MPDTEANARSDNFANAPLDEAVERFVKIIRTERPQVIVTYHEDRNWYPHPDHLRVWEISGPAFDAAGDPDQFPDAGEPWQPSKLYYVAWSMARVKALHAVYEERGQESPFKRWFEGDNPMPDRDERFTTRIDVSEHLGARRAALLAHATQVDPAGHWMAIPDELVREVYPWEDYILARTLVEGTVPEGGYEEDLFAGLREPARRAR
jgi:mycothiol S-conjugate amidase